MGTITDLHYDFEFEVSIEDKEFRCSGYAEGTEWHEAGRFYMPNGDPGYPDEYDFTIEDVIIEEIVDISTEEEVEVNDPDIKDLCQEKVYEQLQNVDSSEWKRSPYTPYLDRDDYCKDDWGDN